MMKPATLHIDAGVRDLLRIGVVSADEVTVGPAETPLKEEIDTTCRAIAAEHAGKSPGDIPGIGAARQLYRAFGIDPTRTRPSSEALLRRVLKSKPFPAVLNAVDLCNLAALRSLLPLGLYDTDLIDGEVTLRRGEAGEEYPGIRKEAVHLAGRPTLADAKGAFGNPTSDSLRTAVTTETRRLWLVVFAPYDYDNGALDNHLEKIESGMRHHLAAQSCHTEIL